MALKIKMFIGIKSIWIESKVYCRKTKLAAVIIDTFPQNEIRPKIVAVKRLAAIDEIPL